MEEIVVGEVGGEGGVVRGVPGVGEGLERKRSNPTVIPLQHMDD